MTMEMLDRIEEKSEAQKPELTLLCICAPSLFDEVTSALARAGYSSSTVVTAQSLAHVAQILGNGKVQAIIADRYYCPAAEKQIRLRMKAADKDSLPLLLAPVQSPALWRELLAWLKGKFPDKKV